MKTIRCAIYTRKSSEEGLELSFNSLHAQREACEAYILSQAGEGWTCLIDQYDDGGISGGHMERPGLKALLEDIKQGKVDVIVVYKVDRLTRSLTDFSKLVEVFDEHDVSFVSVTQAFNTTNSMGRLTLNVLLSFAQFEREVTGERIRDKIALSRKRGLWTGGLPPLGYDAIDKKLIVNESEAKTVRHIFEHYCELKNVRKLKSEMTRDGYVSKRRTTKTGRITGGKPFERGALYAILKNQTYLGLTTHKDEVFEGKHNPIIDKALFDTAQSILASNRRREKHKTSAKDPSLLSGKIISAGGNMLTPTHAQTHGRRYRYYVERLIDGSNNTNYRPIRLPASELEASVITELSTYLTNPVKMLDDLGLSNAVQDTQADIVKTATCIAESLSAGTLQSGDKETIMRLVQKVELMPLAKGYTLHIDLGALAEMLKTPTVTDLGTTTVSVEMELRVCNNGKKIIIGNKTTRAPELNSALIAALKSAHQIKAMYIGQNAKSLSKIASDRNMDPRHVWRTLKLAFLAPNIQLAVLSGTQPRGLVLKDLIYQTIPISWKEQQVQLGF